MWTSAPTEALQEVQWAGDREGRPYEAARDAVQARFRVVREADPYAPFTDRIS